MSNLSFLLKASQGQSSWQCAADHRLLHLILCAACHTYRVGTVPWSAGSECCLLLKSPAVCENMYVRCSESCRDLLLDRWHAVLLNV